MRVDDQEGEEQASHEGAHDGRFPHADDLLGGRVRLQVSLVDVDGPQGGHGVEDGVDRAHQGSEETADDQAAQADREEPGDESHVRRVRVVEGRVGHDAGHGDPGDDDDEQHDVLEDPADQEPHLGVPQTLRRQGPLQDHLVRAPVVQVQ